MMAAMHRDDITAEVVARLIAEQFPQWSDVPIASVTLNGWDNATFRLGERFSVRLPSADGYVPQVEKEHRWLSVLASQLPVRIPEPVAMGRPNDEFPRPWSIYRWIEGEPASLGRISDMTVFAADLARFLSALYVIDADTGPPAGAHSFWRGGSVATWDEETREVICLLAGDIDASAVTDVWEAAVASTWDRRPVWLHGDVAGSNLLVADGALRAVIDFGCSAVGDPACDLVMAWTFFEGDSREVFRRGLPFDEATWARGRGWALWKALVTIGHETRGDGDAIAAARRFGWRQSPREIVDTLVTEQRRLGT